MRNMRKGLMYALAFVLALVPLLGAFSNEASAASSRVAIIKELKGTVKVKKSGGSKEFTAFAKMSLNEGDVLAVGSGGSAILQFSNGTSEDDRMTVSENTKLTFSKLSSKKGTTTKVSMWSGAAWVDVKSIANAEDQFTLETPTAVMGVRGTHLLVGVDAETGATRLMVAAGIVSTSTPSGGGKAQSVYPMQNALITGDGGESEDDIVLAPADLELLMQQTDASIIEAILRSAEEITKENEEYSERFQEELPEELGKTQADLDRFKSNTQNLLGAIADQAVKSGLLSPERLSQIIEEVQNQTGFTVDLDKKSLTTTAEDEQKKAKQRQAEDQAKKLAEEKKAREQKEQEQQAELKRKLEEARLAAEKAKQAAEEERKRKAQEAYEQRLPAAEKARFEAEKQQREQEQSAATSMPTPTPTPPPTPTPTPVQSANANLSGLSILAANEPIALSPVFAAGTMNYSVTFPAGAAQLTVTPIVEDAGKATVTVNGSSLFNGAVTVNVGTAVTYSIGVVVRAENGTTKTYTVALTRAGSSHEEPSTTSTLASLTVDGQVVPGFIPGHETTTSFTTAVAHDVESVSISATATDDVHAIVAGTGSKPVLLGDNSFTITVTAQDGSTREYTLHIVRTMLTGVILSYRNDLGNWTGMGTTPINQDNYNLTALHWQVPYEMSQLRIVPVAAPGVTIVSMNGVSFEDEYFAAMPAVGSNSYSIVTRATSGAESTYELIMEREPFLELPRDLDSWTTTDPGSSEPIEWTNVGFGRFATHTPEAIPSFTMSLAFNTSRGVTSAKLFREEMLEEGQELAAWNESGSTNTISGLSDGINAYVMKFYSGAQVMGYYPLYWVNGPEVADWTALGYTQLIDESTSTLLQPPSKSGDASYFAHVLAGVSEVRIQLSAGMNDQRLYLKGSSEPLTTSQYASYVVNLEEGYNDFEIVVTDRSGLFSATYELSILRWVSADAPYALNLQGIEREDDALIVPFTRDSSNPMKWNAIALPHVTEMTLSGTFGDGAQITEVSVGDESLSFTAGDDVTIPLNGATDIRLSVMKGGNTSVYHLHIEQPDLPIGVAWLFANRDGQSYPIVPVSGAGETEGGGSYSYRIELGDSPAPRNFEFIYGFHSNEMRNLAYRVNGGVEVETGTGEIHMHDLAPGEHVITFTYEAKNPFTGVYHAYTLNFSMTVRALQSGSDIQWFSFTDETNGSHINSSNNIITVYVDGETDTSAIIANFGLSPYASAYIGDVPQTSGSTVNNFDQQVTYRVVAEDGITFKDWTIIVSRQ